MDDTDSDRALAIMRGWEWEGYSGWDEHSRYGPITRSLSDAVNELAFRWHGDAPDTVLSLLAAGKLLATGNFIWRAFRRDEHLQHEDSGVIPADRWQCLSDTIAERLKAGWDEGYSPIVNLQRLGLGETDKDNWVWRDSRFSIAGNAGDGDGWMPDYFEEWFSAWNIEIFPAPTEMVTLEALPSPERPAIERNKGGRPPIYDWEAAKAAVTLECASRVTVATAQAEIEEAFKLWFARRGESPSDSRVRDYAGPLLRTLKSLSVGEANNLAA